MPFPIGLSALLDRMSHLLLIVSAMTFVAFVGMGTPAHAAVNEADVIGVWYDAKRAGAVQISKCGSGLCGKIVWLKAPLRKDGKPLMDVRNSARAKRGRTICGLQVLGSLKQAAPEKQQWNGWVYSPRRGKQYRARVTLKNKGKLLVRGYVSVVALGKTETWTRAPGGLKPCSAVKAVPAAVESGAGKKPTEQKQPTPAARAKRPAPESGSASDALKAD